MPDTPMTLIERLRNPAWVGSPGQERLLDIERTLADMQEAAEVIESMNLP